MQLGQLGGLKRWGERADERDRVTRVSEAQAPGAVGIGEAADHADDRGRVDRAGGGLVVERHVAADDRCGQRPAGITEAADGFGQLPGDVGALGVAEVEVVGRAQWLSADAGEVGGALEHRLDRAHVGVGGDAAAVAVDRNRQGRGRSNGTRGLRIDPIPVRRGRGRMHGLGPDREHSGVGLAGAADGAGLDDRVVLLEQGPAGGEVRAG